MAIEMMPKFAVVTIAATGLTALSLGLATPAFAGGLATVAVYASSHAVLVLSLAGVGTATVLVQGSGFPRRAAREPRTVLADLAIAFRHRQHRHAFQPKHHRGATVVAHLEPFCSCSVTPRTMRPQAHSQDQADNRVTRPLPRFIAKTHP